MTAMWNKNWNNMNYYLSVFELLPLIQPSHTTKDTITEIMVQAFRSTNYERILIRKMT